MINNNDKYKAKKIAYLDKTIRTIIRGLRFIWRQPHRYYLVYTYMLICILLIGVTGYVYKDEIPLIVATRIMSEVVLFLFAVPVIGYIMGRPVGASKIERSFVAIGWTDALGNPPEVEDIFYGDRSIEIHMRNVGRSISEWEDRRADLETGLGIVIANITIMRGSSTVVLKCVPYKFAFNNEDIHFGNCEERLIITLGSRADGYEVVDLNKTAHCLVGGSTGSGKTELVRTMLAQLITNYHVIMAIIDFKGGLDYQEAIWKEARIITDYDGAESVLDNAILEMTERKKEFLYSGVKNIQEFNALRPDKEMKHYVIATDEIAEMLDKTGCSKEKKEIIDRIIEKTSTIARLGRAYGIHLILATQRPDANVLPGQIKNNLTYRACGHADNTLSQIVIDSTLASDIPAGLPGRFVNGDGEEFQAVMMTDYLIE